MFTKLGEKLGLSRSTPPTQASGAGAGAAQAGSALPRPATGVSGASHRLRQQGLVKKLRREHGVRLRAVRGLLSNERADVNHPDAIKAVAHNPKAALRLMTAGADPNKVAEAAADPQVLQAAFERGADAGRPAVIENAASSAALAGQLLSHGGDPDAVMREAVKSDVVELALNHGADPNRRFSNGLTLADQLYLKSLGDDKKKALDSAEKDLQAKEKVAQETQAAGRGGPASSSTGRPPITTLSRDDLQQLRQRYGAGLESFPAGNPGQAGEALAMLWCRRAFDSNATRFYGAGGPATPARLFLHKTSAQLLTPPGADVFSMQRPAIPEFLPRN